MANTAECVRCNNKTTNLRTKLCDICKVKDLVKKWGSKDYKI